jgi:L-ascorbate metabolism protein UlaG (beta-lactamase superfamily)
MGQSRRTSALTTALRVALSGVRRYPGELIDSVRGATHAGVRGLVVPPGVDVAAHGVAAAWLGHASVLVKVDDAWILTDPVLSLRIGMRLGATRGGGERVFGLARRLDTIDVATLPPIDVILLSHAHYDHLDVPTLETLAARSAGRTGVIAAAGLMDLVPKGFAWARELAWDEVTRAGTLTIRALAPRHWGARTVLDRSRGFNAYHVQGERGSVFFAGDTAWTRGFAGARADVSLFGIGAYDPWEDAHATPEDAWDMHVSTGSRYMMPIHHRTFRLSDEPSEEPMARLRAVAGGAGGEGNGAGGEGSGAGVIVPDDLGRLWVPGM